MKKTKKKTEKVVSKKKKTTADYLENLIIEYMKRLNKCEPLTAEQIKEYKIIDKKRAQEAIKEKKRRAKKITMTVGEFEDKLEEARDDWRYGW